MLRTSILAFGALVAAPAFAAPLEVSCNWHAPDSKPSGMSGKVAGLFDSPATAAYFRIDVNSGSVANADSNNVQTIFFPTLILTSSTNAAKITVTPINVKDLKGTTSYIEISIDRFTLASTMLLAMPSAASKTPTLQWIRYGQCSIRTF
jgi:hypothetical protein